MSTALETTVSLLAHPTALDSARAKEEARRNASRAASSRDLAPYFSDMADLPWLADATADMDDGTEYRVRYEEATQPTLASEQVEFGITDSKGRTVGLYVSVSVSFSGDVVRTIGRFDRERQELAPGEFGTGYKGSMSMDQEVPKGTHNAFETDMVERVAKAERGHMGVNVPANVYVQMGATRDGSAFGAMQSDKLVGPVGDPKTLVKLGKLIAKRVKTTGASYARKLAAGKL